jgi:hypothetical protein
MSGFIHQHCLSANKTWSCQQDMWCEILLKILRKPFSRDSAMDKYLCYLILTIIIRITISHTSYFAKKSTVSSQYHHASRLLWCQIRPTWLVGRPLNHWKRSARKQRFLGCNPTRTGCNRELCVRYARPGDRKYHKHNWTNHRRFWLIRAAHKDQYFVSPDCHDTFA